MKIKADYDSYGYEFVEGMKSTSEQKAWEFAEKHDIEVVRNEQDSFFFEKAQNPVELTIPTLDCC